MNNNDNLNSNPASPTPEPLISADLGSLNPTVEAVPTEGMVEPSVNAAPVAETPVPPAQPAAESMPAEPSGLEANPGNAVGMDVPPVTNIEENPSIVVEPEKKKKKGPVVAVIIILVLIALGVTGYIFRDTIMGWLPFGKQTPKAVFENAISKIDTESMLNTNFDTVSGSVKASFNPASIVPVKSFEISSDFSFDKNAKYMKGSLTGKYDGDSLEAKYYVLEDNAYLYAKELLDKYIELPLEGFWDSYNEVIAGSNLENIDLSGIARHILDDFKAALKDEYFTQTKDGSLTKSTFQPTMEQLDQLAKDFSTKIKNDSELIDLLVKAGADKNELMESLEEAISQKNSSTSSVSGMPTISIYTNNLKNIIKIEIGSDEAALVIDNIVKGGFDFHTSITGMQDVISGKVTYSTSKTEPSYKISLNTPYGTLSFEASMKYNVKIEKEDIDTTKAVKIDELDETDKLFLQVNLMSNEFMKNFMNDFGGLFGSLESSSSTYDSNDFDFDFDEDEFDFDTSDFDFDFNV